MTTPPSRNDPTADARWVGRLFDAHARSVYGYALRVLGRADAAEDVVAETFLRACCGRAGFRGESKPLTWLIRIASRVCLDALGRPQPKAQPTAAVSRGPRPSAIERDERTELIAAALDKLPFAQRQVVVLKQFTGLTFQQIADSLDVPLGTVLGRMHRAIAKLADDPSLRRWMKP
jgi:RNA polymerase sigma-70 factor (ECF subfamily)